MTSVIEKHSINLLFNRFNVALQAGISVSFCGGGKRGPVDRIAMCFHSSTTCARSKFSNDGSWSLFHCGISDLPRAFFSTQYCMLMLSWWIKISHRRSTPSAVYSTVSRWLATRAWSRFALRRSRYQWPELLHPSTRPPRVQGQKSHSPCSARYLPCLEVSSRPSTWWLKMGHPRLWGGLRRAPEAMVSFQGARVALWGA